MYYMEMSWNVLCSPDERGHLLSEAAQRRPLDEHSRRGDWLDVVDISDTARRGELELIVVGVDGEDGLSGGRDPVHDARQMVGAINRALDKIDVVVGIGGRFGGHSDGASTRTV